MENDNKKMRKKIQKNDPNQNNKIEKNIILYKQM